MVACGRALLVVAAFLAAGASGSFCAEPEIAGPLRIHPYHRANNVGGIDGNPSGDDTGNEVHDLKVPAVTRLQEAYVRKVIDTLGDLDNVLWEIGNECHAGSVAWQVHMIRRIKSYEATRPKQHPVGMTGAPINAPELLDSPADWISPPGKPWLVDPPANDGAKVILVDTDHCDPWNHDPDWVWKNLFRGNQFLLMDAYMDYRVGSPAEPDPKWDATRQAMGRARAFSEQIDLAAFVPRGQLASTGYCLAGKPGGRARFAVYLPKGGQVTVDLGATKQALAAAWLDPVSGETRPAAAVSGGGRRTLIAPLAGPAILLLMEEKP
jgi:hypothetical protein